MKKEVVTFILIVSLTISAVQCHAFGEGWVKTGQADPTEVRPVTFAIKQTNPEWLEKKLWAVSYPNSTEYGHYMNFDEIAEHVHGKPESVEAVLSSLEAVGVHSSSVSFTLGRDFAVAKMSVKSIETLFTTALYEYEEPECGDKFITADYFSVPTSLRDHVDFVSGVKTTPSPSCKGWNSKKREVFDPDEGTTPITLAKDYNTSDYVATNAGNSQAVSAFLKQYYDPKDLEIFQKKYDLPKKPIAKEVGKNEPDDPGSEANLDVQYISASGRGVDTWFVSTSTYSNGKQEDFLSWILTQVNSTDSPWVHSTSYGDDEKSIDPDYLSRVNNEFMKFGISGRTLLFASGDSGANCKGWRKKYTPSWPTCSPYVTSVGGTETLSRVWVAGGGGFSDVSPMPDYQKEAVEAYLSQVHDTSKFNKAGRAYPDVSAIAVDYLIVVDGVSIMGDGTSCSTPTVAGIISLLNDIRLTAGKSTMGFLNPWLYQNKGKGFIDVTEGKNGGNLCAGFETATGWDAASGWGGPNFGLLKDMV